jgi:pimeloyl-ACP methyl ester carboxylesterase
MSSVPQSPDAAKSGILKVALLMSALVLVGLFSFQYAMPGGTMLILRGIADAENPRGQLDDQSAKLYALSSGYGGKVLDIAGGTSEQMQLALDHIRANPRVTALYGFSGGGYTTQRIWSQLSQQERARIRKIVVVGAPGLTEASFPGAKQVVIQPDPPEGHMEGPRALLYSGK